MAKKKVDIEMSFDYDESEIDWSGDVLFEDSFNTEVGVRSRRRVQDLDEVDVDADLDEGGLEENEDEFDLDLDLDDIDEKAVNETNTGKDLVSTLSNYIREKHNLKWGSLVKKKKVEKIKCDSPKKFALVMSEFDGNAIIDMSLKGIKFTYLVRAPEELYRITLSVDRKELLVIVVGAAYGLDLDGMKEIYYNAVHIDVLDYRPLKAQGINVEDCFFDEVMFVSRYFMAHLFNITIDWEPGELDLAAAEVVEETILGYYEDPVDLEFENSDELSSDDGDFELDLDNGAGEGFELDLDNGAGEGFELDLESEATQFEIDIE